MFPFRARGGVERDTGRPHSQAVRGRRARQASAREEEVPRRLELLPLPGRPADLQAAQGSGTVAAASGIAILGGRLGGQNGPRGPGPGAAVQADPEPGADRRLLPVPHGLVALAVRRRRAAADQPLDADAGAAEGGAAAAAAAGARGAQWARFDRDSVNARAAAVAGSRGGGGIVQGVQPRYTKLLNMIEYQSYDSISRRHPGGEGPAAEPAACPDSRSDSEPRLRGRALHADGQHGAQAKGRPAVGRGVGGRGSLLRRGAFRAARCEARR